MTKHNIRTLKSHYGVRWAELRHFQKTKEHVLCLENKFIINEALPGPVLGIDCLGEVYQGILDIDTVASRKYNTLLLINNVEFKYSTVDELASVIKKYSNGIPRVIVNFSIAFLIYDRLALSPKTVLNQIEQQLQDEYQVKNRLLFNRINNYGFGNAFLSLDCHV
jgi:GMP synthase PP-ATPase subunit